MLDIALGHYFIDDLKASFIEDLERNAAHGRLILIRHCLFSPDRSRSARGSVVEQLRADSSLRDLGHPHFALMTASLNVNVSC